MKYEVVLRESEEGFSVPCPGVALIPLFSPESPPTQPTLPSPYRGERVRVRGRPSNQCQNELHLRLNRGGLGIYSLRIACNSDLLA